MHRAATALQSGAWPLRDPPANLDQQHEGLAFDRFVLTPGERLLTRDDVPVEIGGRSFDLLLALVEQPGRVAPKRELLQRVWPGVIVEDSVLRFHMTRLRRVLNDGRDGARLIATQVGVGYAFVGVLRRLSAPAATPSRVYAPPRPVSGLPSRLDRMIGRERDLKALVERAAVARLLTIVGPAGVGKTSLAVEAAHALEAAFPDGVDFIDLATVEAADHLAPAVAQVLGLPVGADGGGAAAALDALRGQRRLLVLDTCEHLVQAVGDLAERIAATAPEVRILATSRQPLRARNEHVHRLDQHAVPVDVEMGDREALLDSSAVQLFLHHAATAGGAVGQDVEALRMVARLCQGLDGLALAIELAAVRAATHGVEATARMLGDRLSLLWPGRRTASPRQHTLEASLDWSYELLSHTERRVFEALSRLVGPFSLEAALATVAGDIPDLASAAAALDELADKSLILPRDGQYRWSQISRLYARERATARPALGQRAATPRTIPDFRCVRLA
jgi:predicted ATPase/DNA-binding winged helix-turn-helix (wHTH) protein